MVKEHLRNLPLIILSLVLAFFLTFTLLYFNFYVHELGHANIALLSTQTNQISSVTINFTYQPLLLFGYDTGLMYPQQTKVSSILVAYSSLFKVAGIIFSLFFWAIIFLLLGRIEIIKNNKYLSLSLAITFIILILNDFVTNFFCGTDGFNFTCSDAIFNIIFYSFWGIILLSLGFFFTLLFGLIKNKSLKKNEKN